MARRFIALAALAMLALAGVTAPTQAAPSQLFRPPHPTAREASLRAGLQHLNEDGSNAGEDKNCIVCVLVVSLMEQYAWDSNQTLTDAANQWCTDATVAVPLLAGACRSMLGPIIADLQDDFANKLSPDVSCAQTLGMCTGSCRLFPTWPPPAHSAETPRLGVGKMLRGAGPAARHKMYAETAAKLLNVHDVTEQMVKTKLSELRRAGLLPEHLAKLEGDWVPVPIPDFDQDKYGSTFTYRGLQWRGKDCNDANAHIYPGRNAFQGDFDRKTDSNCNGISGADPRSGQTWESILCEPTPSRGLLAIGDSATAHFSLPPSYITPAGFDADTYIDLIKVLVTEADWPQCSWSTAWAGNDACPYSALNVSSIYQRMLARNRCMHRDYVNAGVNGASMQNLVPDGDISPANYTGAMLGYPPRFKVDGPSSVFFSLIGNDICGRRPEYTPVATFEKKAREAFAYLDTVLARGSHIIVMGLVDGRVLYDTLKGAYHPVGTPYPAFYDFLNCEQTSPCSGWMNSNQTIRDQSSAHAAQLNEVYGRIIANTTYQNFDVHYFFPDYAAMVGQWEAAGHNPLELIEAVDGFHPSQTGNMLLAQAMWDFMAANVPEAMGPHNPNNDEILAMFGDQGGYV